MERPQLAVVIEMWVVLLFCQSAQVVSQLVTCSPSEVMEPVGAAAAFTCKFPNMNNSEYTPNLYRDYNESQGRKIIELKEKQGGGKYSVVRVDSRTFVVNILNLEKEDTGKYYCGLISFSLARPVIESNRSTLTVTEKANTTAEPDMQEEEEESRGWNAKEVIPLACVGGAALILGLAFLAFWLLKAVRRKQGALQEEETWPAENAALVSSVLFQALPPVGVCLQHPEREPPAVNIFTVDYGILEFPPKAPPRRPAVEKTEYATIVFPTCGKERKGRFLTCEKSPKLQNYPGRAELS
ncbi:programmed cell death protein 1 [Heteronotia binoei]|uniref:programmed cell death protein 1 n=1 Tax=Heteronotia binoei TaxID=13085 RepID=UPI00292EABB1|nr:programmed cell death protein 1 [Heteronotia binoei]